MMQRGSTEDKTHLDRLATASNTTQARTPVLVGAILHLNNNNNTINTTIRSGIIDQLEKILITRILHSNALRRTL